jgi:hypothetical protein
LTKIGLQTDNVRVGLHLSLSAVSDRERFFENSEALERVERLNYRHGPCGLPFALNGSASNCRGECVTIPAAWANLS